MRKFFTVLLLILIFVPHAWAEKKEFGEKKSLKHEAYEQQPDNSYIIEAECPNCKKVFPVWVKKGTKLTDSVLKSEIECPKCGIALGPKVNLEGDYE